MAHCQCPPQSVRIAVAADPSPRAPSGQGIRVESVAFRLSHHASAVGRPAPEAAVPACVWPARHPWGLLLRAFERSDLLAPGIGRRGRRLLGLLPNRHRSLKCGVALLQALIDSRMIRLTVDPGAKAPGLGIKDAKVTVLATLAEVELLPPVIRDWVVPAQIAAAQHLAWSCKRPGEAVAGRFRVRRIEIVRRVEIRHQDIIDRVGELVSLTRIAHLNQKLNSALATLRRLAREHPPTEGIGQHLEHLVTGG